jgi:hypothetical protein
MPDAEPASRETAPPRPETPAGGAPVEEIGGRDGPDPTRYGDWEKNGRCIDF